MAETRRIAITTVGSLKKDKKPKESAPTLRFNLALLESNDKTCPEFNYNDLVKSSRLKNNSGLTTGEEIQEDDKLRALAKKFEAKYGPRQGKKQKKNIGRIEDYIDLGMGYDENDPFIDNTDAYDELVPSTLTTQHGGFYINSGKLNFKEVDSSDETSSNSSDFETVPDAAATKKRRRRLKELDKDKRRKRIRDGDGQKKKAWKTSDKTDSALLKQKKSIKQPTVASLLLQHKAQQPIQSTMTSNVLATTSTGQTGPGVVNVSNGKLANSTIVDAIESVINASRDHNSIDAGLNTATGSSDSEMATSMNIEPEEEPNKLPDNLSPDLDCLLRMIKETAEESKEGKCKFFSNDVNNILLEIELKTRQLVCSQRSMVYSHLASHLPCTKETLLKRVKKLRLDQEGGKLKEPMAKFRHAILIVMPTMIEKYNQERQKLLPDSKNALNSESDDLSDSSISGKEAQIANASRPRRKFEWNDNLRHMLMDIVRIKMKCYEVSKTRSQSAGEFLRQFLDSEVKHLWPKGWMQTRTLYKESSEAHSYLTNKPKRHLALTSKKFLVSSMLGVVDGVSVVPNKPATSYLPNGIVANVPTPASNMTTNWSAKSLTTKPASDVKPEVPAMAISVTSTTVAAASTTTSTTSAPISIASNVCTLVASTSAANIPKPSATISKVVPTEALSVAPTTASNSVKATVTATAMTNKSDVFAHSSTSYHEGGKNEAVLPRATSSVESITVSSLLKQSSSASGLSNQHSLKSLVGGLKYRAMDYSESLQAAAVLSNPSPNDVLDQIIHASLADFPSSGASKIVTSDTSVTNSVTTQSAAGSVATSYCTTKHGPAVNSVELKSPLASSRSQVSLLKNPPSGNKMVETVLPTRTTESFPGHSARTAPATVTKMASSDSVSQSQSGKISGAYNMVVDRNSASSKSAAFTTPFQSVFEFPEAIERTLQGKSTGSPSSINYGLYPGMQQQNFRKEQNDLVISSLYSQFARKEANELSPHISHQSSFTRKDLMNEQPLNFSQARHTGPSSTSTSNCAFNNRVSPVPTSTYSSPLKEGTKQQQHDISGHTSTRPAVSLPPTTYSSSINSSSRQTSGTENIFAGSPHSAYVSTSPIQTTTSPQVTRSTSLTTSTNHTLYAGTGSSPNQNKLLTHYSTGMDYNTTLSQVLNPSWHSTNNPSSQSVYNRHYAKMLPHVGLQTPYTTTSKAGSLLPHHSPASSRNPPPSTPSYDQGSSF